MEELELLCGDSIEIAVKKLLKAKAEGKHVFANFNGVKLYSDNVTLDSAYMEICGCTKKEYDEEMKKDIEKIKKRLEEDRRYAIENIPNQVEKGKEYIYPFRHEDWAKTVEADANGDYYGLITKYAIEIMSAIEEEKPIEELVEIFKNQNHSNWSASLTRSVVMKYSRNGYPFYKATHDGNWRVKECEFIQKIIKENENNIKDLHIANDLVETKKEVNETKKRLIRSKNKGQL